MKTILKERILNLVLTMESANEYLSGPWEKESAGDLFAACQEAAMQVGRMLEENEPALTDLVAALEEYCELIYRLYIGEKTERAALLDQLKKAAADIRTGIESGVSEEKVKAVFLPYNASMWDAFDSVYRAAKADPRFEVKVIPIPYYSLDPQGQPLEEHYEGQEIAKYAEITDYKTWSPILERPDVVFIHNPYDDCNLVTRISERFFSSELVKYTPHLVYIPYYVTKGKAEGSSYMPGVRNAWRIFVQNEAIREQYISEGIAAEKIAALGSPKLDMVTGAEAAEIPEEWSVLKGKRVFFYNTALTDILHQREAFLKKVRRVISAFRGNTDAALLWRPHPLSVATMESMTPELLEDYLSIVESFKRSGLGVFDESGDLNRAIAVSDAYIGHISSSVSQLYEATGKPVFYVDYDHEFEPEHSCANGLGSEIVDRKLYMFSWEYNRIFIYDMDSKELRVERGDPRYASYEAYLYTMSILIDRSIYFMPGTVFELMKYDPATGGRTYTGFKTEDDSEKGNQNDYVYHRGKIYMLPTYAEQYIKALDLKSGTITRFPTNYSQYFSGQGEKEKPFFCDMAVVGNTVWRACFQGPFIQRFDLISHRTAYIKINGLEVQLGSLAYDGKHFWILPIYGTNIYQWDPRENKIRRTVAIKRRQYSQDDQVFHTIYFAQGSMWVTFRKEYCVIRIDTTTGEPEELEFAALFEDCPNVPRPTMFSRSIKQLDDWLCLIPAKAERLVLINTVTKEVRCEKIPVPNVLLDGEKTKVCERMCTLEKFMQECRQSEDGPAGGDGTTAGTRIWKCVAEQLYT